MIVSQSLLGQKKLSSTLAMSVGCTSHSEPCNHILSSLSSRVDVPQHALSAGFSVVEM